MKRNLIWTFICLSQNPPLSPLHSSSPLTDSNNATETSAGSRRPEHYRETESRSGVSLSNKGVVERPTGFRQIPSRTSEHTQFEEFFSTVNCPFRGLISVM
ncbi:class I peptide chain release factor [Striga asiatica]|uniref:Class I peptide chain release factor n=1 Tax=Striga asiatica TaxID=4170 RepID=A0A5A7PKA8_STRAF|nr:class I peptide chain release factor [Striga asiatica]